MPEPEEKLTLVSKASWPLKYVGEYLGLSVAQVEGLSDVQDGYVDRFIVEKRLARDGRSSLQQIALSFGVPQQDLLRVIQKGLPGGPPPVDLSQFASEDCYLVPRRFVEAWVKELLPRDRVFSSLDSRAKALANVMECAPLPCAVSTYFDEAPPAVATVRCIATWDFVSRAHQEAADNGKHLSLEPDHIGWHALYATRALRDRLYRTDLTNLINYVEERGRKWPES
jgi:hypothetical protein